MSKSLGNVITPSHYIKGVKRNPNYPAYGTDTLRLWLSSTNYSKDVNIGDEIINKVNNTYLKIRNVCKYLVGNLYDYTPIKISKYDSNYLPNQYILYELNDYIKSCNDAFKNYDFLKVYQKTANFISGPLSSIYFEITKNILYLSYKNDNIRKDIQNVFNL